MGTRSRIGIQLKDDSILSVYCHWDGYPSFNGRVLHEFYNTPENVADLINGGNISSLHTNAGWNNETLPETGPQYYTSRGESIKDNEPRIDSSLKSYTNKNMGEEYHYVYREVCDDHTWVCIKMNEFDDDKQPEVVSIPVGSIND